MIGVVREALPAARRFDTRQILLRCRHPPDKQNAVTHTVREQTELLSEMWT